jgi:hypothetical protein
MLMMGHAYFASADVAAAWIRIALRASAPVDLRRLRAARRAEDDRRRLAAGLLLETTCSFAEARTVAWRDLPLLRPRLQLPYARFCARREVKGCARARR